jgi:hypothetical protein
VERRRGREAREDEIQVLHSRLRRSFRMTICCAAILGGAALLARRVCTGSSGRTPCVGIAEGSIVGVFRLVLSPLRLRSGSLGLAQDDSDGGGAFRGPEGPLFHRGQAGMPGPFLEKTSMKMPILLDSGCAFRLFYALF